MNLQHATVDAQMRTGSLQRYLLFVTSNASDRKLFVSSFDDKDDAITTAKKLKEGGAARWQIIDGRSNDVVAEDQGASIHE